MNASSGRVRVKYCGITRAADASQAAALGVDAIGMVFVASSPRAVTLEQARTIVAALPPFVTAVALFVNPAASDVQAVLGQLHVDILQFHGEEAPGFCRAFGIPYVKAIRMRADADLPRAAERYEDAAALLLDTYREGMHGGTGGTFDWGRVPQDLRKPVILAGGLTPDNVAAAIHQARPYAVDVSGGIEAEKGIKDPQKMRAFMQEVQRGIN